MTYRNAALAAGISRTTFFMWNIAEKNAVAAVKKGYSEDSIETTITRKVIPKIDRLGNPLVDAQTGKPLIQSIEQITVTKRRPPTWQPAMAFLERRNPEMWGRRMVQHSGEIRHQHQGGILIAPADMTPDEWIQSTSSRTQWLTRPARSIGSDRLRRRCRDAVAVDPFQTHCD